MSKPQREDMVKWVKALRSGEYTQARGSIVEELANNQYAFCCLGVLAMTLGGEVADPDEYEGEPTMCIKVDEEYVGSTGCMGIGWIGGLSSDWVDRLIELNDDDLATFDNIADYIEVELIN